MTNRKGADEYLLRYVKALNVVNLLGIPEERIEDVALNFSDVMERYAKIARVKMGPKDEPSNFLAHLREVRATSD